MPPNGQHRIRPAQFIYEAGQVEPEHAHDDHQLVYASQGLFCVDTASSRWVLPPLRAAWVPAHVPHTVTAKTASTMSTLYIDTDTDETTDHTTVMVVSVSPLLRELILHISHAALDTDARDHVESVIFDQISAAPAAPLELLKLRDQRTRAIADCLERDPTDDRTLRQFGAVVGANERTLQRLFAAETGSTFGQWRTQVRLQHGIVALGEGASVTDAAIGSGYHEPSSFIAAFRAAFGTTPGRYFTRVDPEPGRRDLARRGRRRIG